MGQFAKAHQPRARSLPLSTLAGLLSTNYKIVKRLMGDNEDQQVPPTNDIQRYLSILQGIKS
jgi:hypothetical protein